MAISKTISFDCILLAALGALLLVGGCSPQAPPCPFTGAADTAPSAGCLVLDGEQLLVVQNFSDQVSLPGGSSEAGEAAQCTAFRETWEETGLRLQPGELLAVFETGFHLYRCERDSDSGEINPPPRLEVQTTFYLPSRAFGDYRWRFPGQEAILKSLIDEIREVDGRVAAEDE